MSIAGPLNVTVSLSTAPPLPLLEQQWRTLEAQSDNSYFTSWSWIGCWLRGLEPGRSLQVLSATREGRIVGMGLLLEHTGRRLKLLPSRGLYLHATGDLHHDDLTIEHNGLLLHRDGAADVAAAMFGHLLQQQHHWDRLELPGLSGSTQLASLKGHGTVAREQSFASHYADLTAVRARQNDYLSLLSSNTRAQIRRSLKAYAELGPVALDEAADLPTALQYLDKLKALHQRHWVTRGERGVFANPWFDAFHQRHVKEAFAAGHVQLLRIRAGEHDIGYLYNFIHRGQVLFYQSGLDYQLISKHGRPGLVAHALAIQHNATQGHMAYDFLAGDTRYKQSLSSGMRPMVWVSVHRDTLAFRVEEWLRRMKRRLQGKAESASSSAPPGKRDSEATQLQPLLVACSLAMVQALVPGAAEANAPLAPFGHIIDLEDLFEPRPLEPQPEA